MRASFFMVVDRAVGARRRSLIRQEHDRQARVFELLVAVGRGAQRRQRELLLLESLDPSRLALSLRGPPRNRPERATGSAGPS